MGDALGVQVDGAGPSLNIYWGEVGAMIPYDVVGAIEGRGAEVSVIGCMSFGAGEVNTLYRVAAHGRAPFSLGIYQRFAPTANANSFYNVAASLTGRVQTLDELRSGGDEWTETCGY